jgi:hypothetical protein
MYYKKIFLASLAALMLISAAGCGGSTSKPAARVRLQASPAASQAAVLPLCLPLVKDAAAQV